MSDVSTDFPVYDDFPQTQPTTQYQNDSTEHPALQPPWPEPNGVTPAATYVGWDQGEAADVSDVVINPTTGPPNHVTHVTITGAGLAGVKQVFIGRSCHNTVVVSDAEVDTDTPGNQGAGAFPVTLQMQDGSETATAATFTYA